MKTIIFDFDGTLADTYTVVLSILHLEKKLNLKNFSPEKMQYYRQLSLKELVKELGLSKLNLFFPLLKLKKIIREHINEVRPIEGIKELLSALKNEGNKLGILTSNSKANVDTFLKLNDMAELFEFVHTDPSLFSKHIKLKKLLKKYNLDHTKSVYIGDGVGDIEAGKVAGVKTVAVTWGLNTPDVLLKSNPDFLARNVEELSIFLDSL